MPGKKFWLLKAARKIRQRGRRTRLRRRRSQRGRRERGVACRQLRVRCRRRASQAGRGAARARAWYTNRRAIRQWWLDNARHGDAETSWQHRANWSGAEQPIYTPQHTRRNILPPVRKTNAPVRFSTEGAWRLIRRAVCRRSRPPPRSGGAERASLDGLAADQPARAKAVMVQLALRDSVIGRSSSTRSCMTLGVIRPRSPRSRRTRP